jgi:O-antigen/teichoic acid export membrane protein
MPLQKTIPPYSSLRFLWEPFFFIMLFFSAPFLEKYFQIQSFSTLAQITGLTIVFNSLGSIQQARYTKELDYAKVTISSGTATLIAGITAAVFARQGAGVFSLAIFLVLQSLIRNALLWLQTDFYPLPQFSWQRFRPLFRYSSKIFLAGGLNWVFDNLYHFSIGKFFSVVDLGFYSQARRIQEFGSHNISSMIQTVAFPTFSKIQNDPRYLKKMFINTLHLSSFVVTPLMITLLVFSEPIILLLLTEKWLSATLYLKILAIVGLLAPLHSINMNVIKAKGRSGVFLNYEIAKKLVIIVAFIVGFQYGITGLVVSQAVASIINLLINTRFSGQKHAVWCQATIVGSPPIFSYYASYFCLRIYIAQYTNGRRDHSIYPFSTFGECHILRFGRNP